MKRLWLALFLAPFAFGAPLEEVRKSYESGSFEQALRQLQEIPQAPVSAELQGALGATWYKHGDLGRAIYHFRRASQLRPRDADIRYNLAFARKGAKDKLDTSGGWVALPFSEKELTVFAALLSLLAGLVGAAWVATRRDWVKGVALACAGFALVGTTGAALAWWTNRPFGVVTAAEAPVRSGPGEAYTHLFTLHAGAEFDNLRRQGDWCQIRLSDGKVGWVAKPQVAL